MKGTLPNRVRFGDFELDLKAGELNRNGRTLLLQEQPFQVLRMLVLNAGKLVTREEIQKKLWPNDTVVEFDHGINTAIQKLRQALGDSADKPSYIETVARRGYRLIVPVEGIDSSCSDEPAAEAIARGEDDPASGTKHPKSFIYLHGLESSSLTGKTLSHYRVLEIIGGGGMGLVYRGEDLKLGRAVALKLLPEELCSDPKALTRFEREARAVSTLSHPNICPIYEFDEYEGQPFIIMELLHGKTLREHLADGAFQLNGPAGLNIAIQVATGLEAAHEKGIIHRDIKPANIFITEKNDAKILDFGLAKLLEDSSDGEVSQSVITAVSQPSSAVATHLTLTGAAIGTAGYMSPEQVRGEKLDARTDIFSFGLVLYEMATGQQAFSGETAALVQDALLNREPTGARQVNPELPAKLEEIINKALQKDPSLRYQHAAEMCFDLQQLKQASHPMQQPQPAVLEEELTHELLRWTGMDIGECAASTGGTDRPQGKITTNPATSIGLPKGRVPGRGYRLIGELQSANARKGRTLRVAAGVVALIAAIVIGVFFWQSRHRAVSTASSAIPRAIAVLPFQHVGTDKDTDFLRLAVPDEIATTLSYVPSLSIRPFATTGKYTGPNLDLQQAGREMGVTSIVTGHYLTEDDRLEVTLEAVDVASNRSVWRDTINVAAPDKIAMREQVTSKVRQGLVPLLGGLSAGDQGTRPKSEEAFDLYLRSVGVPHDVSWQRASSPLCLLMNLGVALVPQGAGAASLAPRYREPSIVSSIKGNNLRIAPSIGSDSGRAHVRDADYTSSDFVPDRTDSTPRCVHTSAFSLPINWWLPIDQ